MTLRTEVVLCVSCKLPVYRWSHVHGSGINVSEVKLDLKKMLQAKDKSVTELTGGIEYLFKKNGTKWFPFKLALVMGSHRLLVQGWTT